VRRVLLLTASIVFVDALFFAVLVPLLPEYVEELGLSKTGAGVLAAAYPAGTFFGAIPSGMVAARLGVKPTVLIGMAFVALTTAAFGFLDEAWQLDLARFCQGLASSFSWTGALAWLVAAAPPGRTGRLIGQAFAAAVAGALFGPVLGGVASVAGTEWTFGLVAVASLAVAVWAATTPSSRPQTPQPVSTLFRALRDPRILLAVWLVVLPALLFGVLGVLAPLRLAELGFGAVAIGAIWLVTGALESGNNLIIGRVADRFGPLAPVRVALVATVIGAVLLPWPDNGWVLAVLIACAGVAFGTFYTPGMTLLTHAAEARALDYGYAFALINLAWAPGQTAGSAAGGAIADATTDAVPYFALAAIALLTLAGLWRSASSS
jgi:predicted MFS family arabinose efflux permease